jgi:hypothetical protein
MMALGGVPDGGYGVANRNVPDGFNDLMSLSNGIMEQQGTIYNDEEAQLFEVNREMEMLIEQMEKKNAKDET